jgi:hypothetical protein
MALSEATRLAGVFITSLLMRVYSLPLAKGSKGAARWSQYQGSSLPTGAALDEQRAHLGHFAVCNEVDKSRGRSIHFVISALTLDTRKGRCPALNGNLCGIYEQRPLTCRTVPMHYSRPLSVLGGHLDRFVRTPGHQCDTSAAAPIVLDQRGIADESLQRLREDAKSLAASEHGWKAELVSLMDRPDAALAAGLPAYTSVLQNSDAGSATSVSMLAAWRVARNLGLLSQQAFTEICRNQIALIDAELARATDLNLAANLAPMRSSYEAELRTAVLPAIPRG